MKQNRTKLLTAFAPAQAAMCFAEDANAAAAGTAGGETPAQAAERKRAPATNFLPIVRGRLPLVFVHALRFDEVLLKMGNKDAATKFATSVGKVFDIRKNRNFTYVGADWKPTAEDIDAAEGWISQIGTRNAKGVSATGDATLMKQVLDQYKARGLATATEAAAQAAAKPQPKVGAAAAAKTTKGDDKAAGTKTKTKTSAAAADELLS